MIRYLLLISLLFFTACNDNKAPANQAPIPKITTNAKNITIGDSITLDAKESYDSDGTIISYQWFNQSKQLLGSNSQLHWQVPTIAGDYTITLKVTDDDGKDAKSTFTIRVNAPQNKAPTATITANSHSVTAGDSITLDASSSSDSDGNIISYQWLNQSNQLLGNNPQLHWQAPAMAGDYTITLQVTDDDGASANANITLQVTNAPTTPFSAIQNLIASRNATYICVGDSTRANSNTYDGGHLFDTLKAHLDDYNTNSILEARVGHEAKQFNLATQSPTWQEIVSLIPGDGSTTIVDISLGINDLFTGADIKANLKEAINKIKAQKSQTHFLLTMPNPKDPTADAATQQSNILKTAYTELSNELNLPLVNIQDEITFTQAMFQNDSVHFHMTPATQVGVAELIWSKISP